MDREYLEDYEQKERNEYERLVVRRIKKEEFDFERDRYPPNERFVNLQKPVAVTSLGTANVRNLWAQIPLCGSLILPIVPAPEPAFEQIYFKVSEIPKIVDFIKETGKLQIVLGARACDYEGLDHLDPFFKELKPPAYEGLPRFIFGSEKEMKKVVNSFYGLANVKYLDFLRKIYQEHGSRIYFIVLDTHLTVYTFLKLGHYTIVKEFEDLMIDNPEKAFSQFVILRTFIFEPALELRTNLRNYTLEEVKAAQVLPLTYRLQETRFPCEIGKFLLKKLTYAPQGLRACNELIDHYDAYDLQKVQESLNEAVVSNNPDTVNKSAEELSEILDNVWNDPEIPKLVKNLRRGVPISIAAIGTALSAFTGGLEGFLAGLGFSVGTKFLDAEIKGLSERIAKWLTRSYQANVYDFKKKYKHGIVSR